MVHKVTKQYIKNYCNSNLREDTKLFVLDLIVDHLLKYSATYFRLIDVRTDMYVYDTRYFKHVDDTYKIEKAYIIQDIVNGLYLWFFCLENVALVDSYEYTLQRSTINFTLSKDYDSKKNILRQEGSPKVFGQAKLCDSSDDVKFHKYECYSFLLSLAMYFDYAGDFYFINDGRSFSVIVEGSYDTVGKYDNDVASYFIYDASHAYHASDKKVLAIHSSKSNHLRTGASQKNVMADIMEYFTHDRVSFSSPIADFSLDFYYYPNTYYSSLVFVPCDTFDTNISGYYSTDFISLFSKHQSRLINSNCYVCDSDVALQETQEPNLNSPYDLSRKDCSTGVPHDYEEPAMEDMFVGATVSYFDGYTLRRQFQIPTAAEIMYRTNSDFNYLDTNSGTNYYSGMLSTLNSSTIAIPNFVSVLREPVELGTMSPVQESTFMYLVDMSKIQTGEVVEVIDNRGNKIKLICFPTHIGEIMPPGDKLFGVGFRFEDVVQIEDYLNIKDMEANSSKSVMTLLNAKNRVSAYLGDVDFKDYQRGTILLNYSYRNVESIEIAYTDMDGDYIQKVSWTARDFIDRMESGESFDLLRSNNNGDYWYIDPIKSTDMMLISGLKNCGIVSISCNRRK